MKLGKHTVFRAAIDRAIIFARIYRFLSAIREETNLSPPCANQLSERATRKGYARADF